jgi:hypothetical protein
MDWGNRQVEQGFHHIPSALPPGGGFIPSRQRIAGATTSG